MQTSEFDSSDEEPIEDEQTPIQISWYVNLSDQWWAKIFDVYIIIFVEFSLHIENDSLLLIIEFLSFLSMVEQSFFGGVRGVVRVPSLYIE